MYKPKANVAQFSLVITFILFAFIAVSAKANSEQLVNDLQLVGEARLSKLFWAIYDSRLYNRSGRYQGIEPGLTLEITYQRKITSQQLVESTREEWQMLRVYKQRSSEQWLKQLLTMWPDVKKDDVLTLRVDNNLASDFYFNGEAIGSIEKPEFTNHFLSIWLSSNARYPKLQQQLIGAVRN